MSATCGLTPFASLEKSGQNGFYWKMSQGSFPTFISDEFSLTWPRAGTMLDGIVFRLAPLAPITRGIECGLWATPRANETGAYQYDHGDKDKPIVLTLTGQVRMFPTPTVGDNTQRFNTSPGSANKRPNLGAMAKFNLWRTPQSIDAKGAIHRSTKTFGKRKETDPQVTLADQVELFPTPTSGDCKNRMTSEKAKRLYQSGPTLVDVTQSLGGMLNPTWVEWLMGWPLGWTALEPLAMDKYQQWLEQHGHC